MDQSLIEKLRNLAGYLSQMSKQHVYHRYSDGDRVLFYDFARGWDEATVVRGTKWGDYTIETPDGERKILNERELRPFREM